jgi:hypothetical protein
MRSVRARKNHLLAAGGLVAAWCPLFSTRRKSGVAIAIMLGLLLAYTGFVG